MIGTGVAGRLLELRQRITRAARAVRRSPHEIVLVAVTKGCSWEVIEEACAAGVRVVGENRVQEAQAKFPQEHRDQLAERYPDFSLHLVGHLQTNKVRRAVELFDLIQSLDSVRLGECVERHATAVGKTQDCLVQVKLSEEPIPPLAHGRSGTPPQGVREILTASARWAHVRISGLMAIAPWVEDPEAARRWFRAAKMLFDATKQDERFGRSMQWLSLGMSHDFEVAIEEGANMVRIGTAIFGPRDR